MNVVSRTSLVKANTRTFHCSAVGSRFAVNEARRKQRRRNWRTLAKQLGLDPNMGNATIKKEAQIRGMQCSLSRLHESLICRKTSRESVYVGALGIREISHT
jgi:hypothetical protein